MAAFTSVANHPSNGFVNATVTFRVRVETNFGDDVYVVGPGDLLGEWTPKQGVLLRTHEEAYPVWFTTISMPLDIRKSRDIEMEYKFVIQRAGGWAEWEEGANRVLPLKLHSDMTMESLPPHVACFGEARDPFMTQLPALAPVLSMSTMATYLASEDGDGMMSPCSSLATLPQLAESPKAELTNEPTPELLEPRPTPELQEVPDAKVPVAPPAPSVVAPVKVPSPKKGPSPRRVATPRKVATPRRVATPKRAASPVKAPVVTPVEPVNLKVESFCFEAGAHRLSKPSGRCEDAFFFSSKAAGVADGVGQMEQFSEYGVDAAKYADELMQLSAKYVHESSGTRRALMALMAAEQNATTFGASTALVMAIDGKIVQVANLGDSGFMHLRPRAWGMEILQTSREQTHGWNCPYQLTRVPEALFKDSGISFDSASDCEKYELKVEQGDLLLLFTDGLTDNLHWHEVLRKVDEVVERYEGQKGRIVPPEELAQVLAKTAEERSHDAKANTPFAQSARRNRLHFPGGKEDDITVVAAWITNEADAQEGHTDETMDVTMGTLEKASARKTCVLS